MDTAAANLPDTRINCTQCGGELHPDEGQVFLTCPFCSSTVYLDKAQVVFHWSVAPTLNPEQAVAALRRWMSGSKTVKDLDRKAKLTSQVFQYFPLWYFKGSQTSKKGTAKEEVGLQPAAATSVTELNRLNIPAGDLQRYASSLDAQAEAPSVPLEAARKWFKQAHPGFGILESALVHVPLFIYKYLYNGKTYTAVVDAASGNVLANIFPGKAETPYVTIGCLSAVIYACLALAPIIFSFTEPGGEFIGLAICFGGGLLAAPILFAIAFLVASKV